jgi:hypothetical protein
VNEDNNNSNNKVFHERHNVPEHNTSSLSPSIINKIEDKLKDNGLVIKNYYFISETFYNRNEDNISHKKVRLLLQHLIGLKTDDNKFTSEEIEEYFEDYQEENTQKEEVKFDSKKIIKETIKQSQMTNSPEESIVTKVLH